MYIRNNGVLSLTTAYIKTAVNTWTRVDALTKFVDVWRGWFRKTGALGAVVNDTWLNYNDYGNYVYIGQWRWSTPAAFASPVRFISGAFSVRVENRDDYGQGYAVRIEGLVNGVWTTLFEVSAVIDAETWQFLSVSGTREPIEITQIRYGVHCKHFWDQANGSVTGWEEFGTYTG